MDESLKNAVKYMSEQLKENPEIDRSSLIDDVSKKYDLNPMQTDFLINKYVLGK
ncbi:MAG TPA: hypothetical protein PK514_04210 [Spirochaetota bacterium]|nr:hypothetical protein [Spirochaetota bacterium]